MDILTIITVTLGNDPNYALGALEIDRIFAKLIPLDFANQISHYLDIFLKTRFGYYDIRTSRFDIYTGIEKTVLQKIYNLDKINYYSNGNSCDIFEKLQKFFESSKFLRIKQILFLQKYIGDTYPKNLEFKAIVEIKNYRKELFKLYKICDVLNFTHNPKFKSINKDLKSIINSYF